MQCGDIWLVDLYDGKGHEQEGTRPCIVMGEANGLSIVVPLTSNLRTQRFAYTYTLFPSGQNCLKKESVALIFQIVSLDSNRFVHRIGNLTKPEMDAVKALLSDLMNLST